MVAFSRSLPSRFLPPRHPLRFRFRAISAVASLALLAHAAPARASHERPWVADTEGARVVATIDLPEARRWKQALPLKNNRIVLLCDATEQGVGSGNNCLMRLSADQTSKPVASPLTIVWPEGGTEPHVNTSLLPVALAYGTDGTLWLLDGGADKAAPRLIRFDPTSGRVLQTQEIPAEGYTPQSRFTAFAVHGDMAYLADEGGIALTVLDLRRHAATRFFAGYPTSRGHVPLTIDGHSVPGKDGHPLTRDLAYLALETNGQWLYELAPTGPIYRLSADLLNDPSVTPSELMEGVTQWRGTPTVSGITIDDKATLYLTDISEGRVLSFDTARHPHILLSSHELVGAGMPQWVPGEAGHSTTGAGELYIPVGSRLLRIALP